MNSMTIAAIYFQDPAPISCQASSFKKGVFLGMYQIDFSQRNEITKIYSQVAIVKKSNDNSFSKRTHPYSHPIVRRCLSLSFPLVWPMLPEAIVRGSGFR